jgi:urease accessory protein
VENAAALRRTDLSDVFAANRAAGRIALSVEAHGGVTRRDKVYEHGPLRVRFPNAYDGALEAVFVNTAGGIAGGDRHDLELAAGEGTALTVTTAAAEKVYRALGPDAEIAVKLSAAAKSRLCWLPQETILFDRARVEREIEADVSSEGSLSICEAIVFGRDAMGEKVARGLLRDRWRIRRDGELIFADALTLDGDIKSTLNRRAAMNGKIAMATMVCVSKEAMSKLDAVREALIGEGVEAGASAFDGILVARILAEDSIALRAAVLSALEAAGTPPPRAYSL